jgi:hypothetical protein
VVLLNDGTGTHFSSTDLDSGGNGAGGVAVGDLAGNGKQDIVAANGFSSTISVLDGNGDGTFGAPTIYAASFPWAVVLADMGQRGKPDIVAANFFAGVSVLLNNGDGTFAVHQDFAGGDSHVGHQELALADFNGDGLPDVASANSNTATVSVERDQFSQVSTRSRCRCLAAPATPGQEESGRQQTPETKQGPRINLGPCGCVNSLLASNGDRGRRQG